MTAKKAKTKSKLTIQEFQTWLQGIMEFQDNDWSPNKDQWEAIYDKIMNLKTETTTTNVSAASIRDIASAVVEEMPNFNQPSAPTHYQGPPRILEEKPLEEFGAGGRQLAPQEPVELIPAEELPNLTQEEIQERINHAREHGTKFNASQPIKTRSIDTSDGNYVSDFV